MSSRDPTMLFQLRLGYISDRSHRYEMLGIIGNGAVIGLSGGTHGPDGQYDVISTDDEVFGATISIGDATGDGWDDLLSSYWDFGLNAGAATLFVGGPYIPIDPSAGVEEIVISGRSDDIRTWPNPVVDELHIVWRGDLTVKPERFEIDDLLGRRVAVGEVESWRGEAYWNCGGVASGIYMLSIYDQTGALLATTRLVKQ